MNLYDVNLYDVRVFRTPKEGTAPIWCQAEVEREWICTTGGAYLGPCSESDRTPWSHRHDECGWGWILMEVDL